jgi:hypothetical protein
VDKLIVDRQFAEYQPVLKRSFSWKVAERQRILDALDKGNPLLDVMFHSSGAKAGMISVHVKRPADLPETFWNSSEVDQAVVAEFDRVTCETIFTALVGAGCTNVRVFNPGIDSYLKIAKFHTYGRTAVRTYKVQVNPLPVYDLNAGDDPSISALRVRLLLLATWDRLQRRNADTDEALATSLNLALTYLSDNEGVAFLYNQETVDLLIKRVKTHAKEQRQQAEFMNQQGSIFIARPGEADKGWQLKVLYRRRGVAGDREVKRVATGTVIDVALACRESLKAGDVLAEGEQSNYLALLEHAFEAALEFGHYTG